MNRRGRQPGSSRGSRPAKSGGWEGGKDVLRIILAIILPPLGVFMQVGLGKHFWINIVLTILGYIPGIVHALWVIVKK